MEDIAMKALCVGGMWGKPPNMPLSDRWHVLASCIVLTVVLVLVVSTVLSSGS